MLGGEICARPLVQKSVKKAMHRVVNEDCSSSRWHRLGDRVDGAARDLCDDKGKTLTAKGEAERSTP